MQKIPMRNQLSFIVAHILRMGITVKASLPRIQRKLFREESKELTKGEYEKLIFSAEEKGNTRLAVLIETIGATGIRVSEVQYITSLAVKAGRTQITLKGKSAIFFCRVSSARSS